MEDVIEHFSELYPDSMVVFEMNEFDRAKLAGKIDLLREIKMFVEEEYGIKPKAK